MHKIRTLAVVLVLVNCTGWAVAPPAPYGAVPSERQLRWHELEFYGFIHFTVNTFTDKEWGFGDEDPGIFNPDQFDADEIVRIAKDAGMRGLILTAKHHDGFCLWPSAYTEHSVKASPWRDGNGDVVREMADACKRAGLGFGVYLSPWDRNHADYGREAYVEYYQKQLRELLSDYGALFEVWFDGANGSDGYYGGARESRFVSREYYRWPEIYELVRRLQPDAVMFQGPDIRWVGNERGIAGDPCWATLNREQAMFDAAARNVGDRFGRDWWPAECDVSIRPGWFYHEGEDSRVRTPDNLVDLYFKSVGRGASLLLNLPPDRHGRIAEPDRRALAEFRRLMDAIFSNDLAKDAKIVASNVRGGDPGYRAENLIDGDRGTYWCADDDVLTPEVILDLGAQKFINVVSLREYLPLGQRVDEWALDAWENGEWIEFAHGAAIGSRRLWRGPGVTTSRVRLRIVRGMACPAISGLGLYSEPEELLRAGPVAEAGGHRVLSTYGWKISGADESETAHRLIDGDASTYWAAKRAGTHQLTIDQSRPTQAVGLIYLPARKENGFHGLIEQYSVETSADGEKWETIVSKGEFGNIAANPVAQTVRFGGVLEFRYLRFTVKRTIEGEPAAIAELQLIEH